MASLLFVICEYFAYRYAAANILSTCDAGVKPLMTYLFILGLLLAGRGFSKVMADDNDGGFDAVICFLVCIRLVISIPWGLTLIICYTTGVM